MRRAAKFKRAYILLFLLLILLLLAKYANYLRYQSTQVDSAGWGAKEGEDEQFSDWTHRLIVAEFMKERKSWQTSELGKMLFDELELPRKENEEKRYTVLIWKVGPKLARRHMNNLGHNENDPLASCSVKNCEFVYEDAALTTADAVIFHLQRNLLPTEHQLQYRKRYQRYIFLTDEAPNHTFLNVSQNTYLDYVNFFNWSMTYRTDSDVPVPYGRVVPLKKAISLRGTRKGLSDLVPNWETKQRNVSLVALISNCSYKKRMKFIEDLKRYMKVDVYGSCAEEENQVKACPGHFRSDCPVINNYYFYLAFENARCYQYITEKTYYNAYSKGSIPVIIGPDSSSALSLLPPHSYIHADNFKNVANLANYIENVVKNESEILAYHQWRLHFEVLNEHGYFNTNSVHYCRVCEALNFNSDDEKVYDREMLNEFLDWNSLCN